MSRKFNLYESIKLFFLTKPPTVIFICCLLSFIFVLLSLSNYIDKHEINNPDQVDWNIFMENMATLGYCIKYPDPEIAKEEKPNEKIQAKSIVKDAYEKFR
jgi:hypothetical protein